MERPFGGALLKLSKFILSHLEPIAAAWVEFAGGYVFDGVLDLDERRDHVIGILEAIARDLDTPQSEAVQARKSKGGEDAAPGDDTAASAHGSDRAATGFTPAQMVAEFRALRASVLHLWSEEQSEFSRQSIEDMTRFNEAIDQALAESITHFTEGVDRSKELLLGVLGHDLRNPLGAIRMSTTLMMAKEGPAWVHARNATRILTGVTRMDELISDLLDFTRSRLGGGIPVVPERMDLGLIAQQTVDEIGAFRGDCVLHLEVSGDLCGRWDGARLAQALSNLVGNACQHGSRGAPVTVVVRGDADDVVMAVHNEGPSIPVARRKDIFDPFSQLAPSGAAPSDTSSIGLGLYIVRAIVDAHHGIIEVASSRQGTTFTVRLPRDPDDARPPKRRRPPSPGARSPSRRR